MNPGFAFELRKRFTAYPDRVVAIMITLAPPSTAHVAPVTYPASGLNRNTITSATSSASPSRPAGTSGAVPSPPCFWFARSMGVSIGPLYAHTHIKGQYNGKTVSKWGGSKLTATQY
ncbi:hypothetical protein CRV24_007554 [Beauveria bassiana]|nr:hypothetical protein CRV24_007554 [Beauveria bassiana]